MQRRLGWGLRRNLLVPMGIEPFDERGYIQKVLTANPDVGYDPSSLIQFLPQNEDAGGISFDHSGLGHHGAYTGVTLGQPGVPGMRMTSPYFDGANDFNNIYSAGFANDNGLLNPGFETPGGGGADIWANWEENAGDGALANEVVVVHEGNDSAKMTSGVTSNTRVIQNIAVVPGENRRLRFWTQGDGINSGLYRIYDNTNAIDIVAPTSSGVTGAAYEMVVQEYTVPPGCIQVRVIFYCPPVNGGVCYLDACEDRRKDGFLGDQGSIIIPTQVANAGVWTDGNVRTMIRIWIDANNNVLIQKSAVNNTVTFAYVAGGVLETQATGALANIDFAFYGITWDISAGANGEVRYYIDDAPSGAMDTGLGTWLGDLVNTTTVIGADSTIPANIWLGNIGPALVYNEAKTPAEMAYLMTV